MKRISSQADVTEFLAALVRAGATNAPLIEHELGHAAMVPDQLRVIGTALDAAAVAAAIERVAKMAHVDRLTTLEHMLRQAVEAQHGDPAPRRGGVPVKDFIAINPDLSKVRR